MSPNQGTMQEDTKTETERRFDVYTEVNVRTFNCGNSFSLVSLLFQIVYQLSVAA